MEREPSEEIDKGPLLPAVIIAESDPGERPPDQRTDKEKEVNHGSKRERRDEGGEAAISKGS